MATIDDDRLKAIIRAEFDDKQVLKDLDELIKKVKSHLKGSRVDWEDFFGGKKGWDLNERMVRVVQDMLKLQTTQEHRMASTLAMNQTLLKIRREDKHIGQEELKVRIARTAQIKLEAEQAHRLLQIHRRIAGIVQQKKEGTYKERSFSPGSYGDEANRRYKKAKAAQTKYRTQGAGSKLYTFFPQ